MQRTTLGMRYVVAGIATVVTSGGSVVQPSKSIKRKFSVWERRLAYWTVFLTVF